MTETPEPDSDRGRGGTAADSTSEAKQRKLAEALRRNLRRRKEAGRSGEAKPDAGPAENEPSTGSP